MAVNDSIPAPGFRTFDKSQRPYLQTIAIEKIMRLHADGTDVTMQSAAVLLILCDRVDSSHGQFYGAWDKPRSPKAKGLIDEFGWHRSMWFRWLERLEEVGLVENLGRLPGRATSTWQVLPDLYRLLSEESDTRDLVDNTDGGSRESDITSPITATALVSSVATRLGSEDRDTNFLTSSNSDSNVGFDIEEEKKRQKAALKARWGSDA